MRNTLLVVGEAEGEFFDSWGWIEEKSSAYESNKIVQVFTGFGSEFMIGVYEVEYGKGSSESPPSF